MISRGAGALALVALIAAAIGCGGDDNKFKKDYQAESKDIQSVGRDSAEAMRRSGRTSDAELARQFTGFARRAQSSVDDLEALDPPKDLTHERDALADAVAVGTGDLRGIAAAAHSGSARRKRFATEKLIEDSNAIRSARSTLDRLAAKE